MPTPLHPAVVHFAVVIPFFLVISTAMCLFFFRRWMAWQSAVLMLAGCAACLLAMTTGEADEEKFGESESLEQHVEVHESAAKITLVLMACGAVVSMAALALQRFPLAARLCHGAAFLFTVIATLAVINTAHLGGELVYNFGAGVRPLSAGKLPGVFHEEND